MTCCTQHHTTLVFCVCVCVYVCVFVYVCMSLCLSVCRVFSGTCIYAITPFWQRCRPWISLGAKQSRTEESPNWRVWQRCRPWISRCEAITDVTWLRIPTNSGSFLHQWFHQFVFSVVYLVSKRLFKPAKITCAILAQEISNAKAGSERKWP